MVQPYSDGEEEPDNKKLDESQDEIEPEELLSDKQDNIWAGPGSTYTIPSSDEEDDELESSESSASEEGED